MKKVTLFECGIIIISGFFTILLLIGNVSLLLGMKTTAPKTHWPLPRITPQLIPQQPESPTDAASSQRGPEAIAAAKMSTSKLPQPADLSLKQEHAMQETPKGFASNVPVKPQLTGIRPVAPEKRDFFDQLPQNKQFIYQKNLSKINLLTPDRQADFDNMKGEEQLNYLTKLNELKPTEFDAIKHLPIAQQMQYAELTSQNDKTNFLANLPQQQLPSSPVSAFATPPKLQTTTPLGTIATTPMPTPPGTDVTLSKEAEQTALSITAPTDPEAQQSPTALTAETQDPQQFAQSSPIGETAQQSGVAGQNIPVTGQQALVGQTAQAGQPAVTEHTAIQENRAPEGNLPPAQQAVQEKILTEKEEIKEWQPPADDPIKPKFDTEPIHPNQPSDTPIPPQKPDDRDPTKIAGVALLGAGLVGGLIAGLVVGLDDDKKKHHPVLTGESVAVTAAPAEGADNIFTDTPAPEAVGAPLPGEATQSQPLREEKSADEIDILKEITARKKAPLTDEQ